MLYHVARNGQTYGPYTLEDLRRYVASGNVLLTDLARPDNPPGTQPDAPPDWVPVAQILGTAAPQGYAPTAVPYAQPRPANMATFEDPPNLSWGLVLLFTILTCGIFMLVWNLIVSAWMRRVQPNSQALLYYIAGAVLLFANGVIGTNSGMLSAFTHGHRYYGHPFGILVLTLGWIVRLIARFTMKNSLEEHYNGPEPLGLRLSGVMTFFFGGLYHQYHLNRINDIKRAMRFSGGLR